MRDILDAVATGEVSPAEAEAELRGYARSGAGRFDAAREARTGIPEAILSEGKTPEETAEMTVTAVETTGSALVTRADDEAAAACRQRLAEEFPDADIERDGRAHTLVVHAPSYEPPALDATVTVVTAGTSDVAAASEAAVVADEMGATVEFIDDVGVAGIARLFDRLDEIRAADALVVAAGREGALPTVTAGLVDVPLIGLPVSTGYGHGGDGEAALSGMIQSCTPITVVNIDAGFTAGAQAGLIARSVSAARAEP
ncbi:MAG: NCAIR mutase (PurE)-related protein [Natronomonas sp.]|jgi:NCAIR mutase (PurE)-related protein|uniref:nickel pincer cofactor biosynthesis protein LarB n=1 Tax=Natronomonas sp. TaxID=2184060 RepID=UPI0039897394